MCTQEIYDIYKQFLGPIQELKLKSNKVIKMAVFQSIQVRDYDLDQDGAMKIHLKSSSHWPNDMTVD